MEISLSKKVIASCDRIRHDLSCLFKQNTSAFNNELQRKISHIEFCCNELLNRKEKLTAHAPSLLDIKCRTQQTIQSLQYPKETCLKCLEIRKNIPELRNDAAENELNREIELIDVTQTFFKNMVDEIDEQIRRYRAKIYSLEEDIQRKNMTLKIEKTNKNIKITDTDFDSIELLHSDAMRKIYENSQNTDWENDTLEMLRSADAELGAGEKLKLGVEESLLFKTTALITQYNLCNEAFHKCLAQHKYTKSCLEIKSSNANDEIPKVKQTIRDVEHMIAENEALTKLAEIRLHNRMKSTFSELSRDNVEIVLTKELNELGKMRASLSNRWSAALSTLETLNSAKKHYESEIEAKMNAIKKIL